MSAGYIGQNPTQNIFKSPGVWHSKEQYQLKRTGDWDPEYKPFEVKYAFWKDSIDIQDTLASNTFELYYPNIPSMEGIAFSSNGLLMYLLDNSTYDAIIQFTLTAAFSPSAIDPSKTKFRRLTDIGSKTPVGIRFKSDGTSLYIADILTNTISQMDMSIPWDVTTAIPSGKALHFIQSSTTNNNNIVGFAIKSDGTKVYGLSNAGDAVYQYTLTTAWDISTWAYDGVSLSVSAQDSDTADIDFSPDGTKLYYLGRNNRTVYQYTLPTPWSLTGATFATSFSVAAIESDCRGITFKGTGDQYYITGGSRIHEFFCPSSGAINLSTYSSTTVTGTDDGTSLSLYVGPEGDGTRLWVMDFSAPAVEEFKLSVPWDTSSATFTGNSFNVSRYYSGSNGFRDFTFKPDGTVLYLLGLNPYNVVWQLNLTTAWDVGSAVVGTAVSFNSFGSETSIEGIKFKPDGTKMFVVGTALDQVRQWNLSTPWNVGTATSVSGVTTSIYGDPLGIDITDDGTRMIVISVDRVTEYSLSPAWDVSAGQPTGITFTTLAGGSHKGRFFDGGKRLYTVTYGDDRIREFDLIANKSLINRQRGGILG